MHKFHYVIEDAKGNLHQYTFDIEPNNALSIIEKMRDLDGCKLHIYKHYKTLESSTMKEGG